jgi:hypothetical protein
MLSILSKAQNKDEEWRISRKRALIGTVVSGAGLGITVILMVLFMIHGKLVIDGNKFEIRPI